MLARVAVGRAVAAAYVPARHAEAQMHPAAADGEAVLAARHAVRHLHEDLVEMRATVGHGDLLASGAASRGSRTWKRVRPGWMSTRRSPWWPSTTMRRVMSSPRPVPFPTALVVKNGSKMRRWMSARDAGAVVRDLDHHLAVDPARRRSGRARPSQLRPAALSIRFVHTWFSSRPNAPTRGRSGAVQAHDVELRLSLQPVAEHRERRRPGPRGRDRAAARGPCR